MFNFEVTMFESRKNLGPLIGAIDEGTSSTRFIIFAANNAEMVAYHQIPIIKQCPKEDWVEQDPMEILNAVIETVNVAVEKLIDLQIAPEDIKAIGLTNQRETVVIWDKFTGVPLYNAIVWLDGRTTETVDILLSEKKCDKNVLRERTGLPISPYFSSMKIRWLIDNNARVANAIHNKTCLFGTIDSWLLWNLTGGVNGGLHCTDVTNASRTMLMNIKTLNWGRDLCDFFDIPMDILPEIKSCSEIYGYLKTTKLAGVPLAGCLGDQQSALLGQNCFEKGQAKCTFGTGCFLLYNIGNTMIKSNYGLLTTIGFKLHPDEEPVYALEGSVSVAGAAIQWLCDNLEILKNAKECARVASSVNDTNGVYFVPAFTGLYAPYWRDDARSVICGLNIDTKAGHVVRATLEAICFQVRDIIDSMNSESGAQLKKLLVDGGMTENEVLMQLLADICGVQITRPIMAESSALGAAIAAGYAKGIDCWKLSTKPPLSNDVYYPLMPLNERQSRLKRWKMAIARSLNWVVTEADVETKLVLNEALKNIPELPQLIDSNSITYSNMSPKVFSPLPAALFVLANVLLLTLKRSFL